MSAPVASNIVAIVLRTLGVNDAHMPRSWLFSAEGVVQAAMDAAREEERARSAPVLEAARAWAAVESKTPQPSSTGIADWAERRAAARDALLAAVRGAS